MLQKYWLLLVIINFFEIMITLLTGAMEWDSKQGDQMMSLAGNQTGDVLLKAHQAHMVHMECT